MVSVDADKPKNFLSAKKSHKAGKEGSAEVAIPKDKCIPVAIMVIYNEPVFMGDQGTETILALTPFFFAKIHFHPHTHSQKIRPKMQGTAHFRPTSFATESIDALNPVFFHQNPISILTKDTF